MNLSLKHLQWDIFCKVIDNFGDVGICWRLAADLGARGHRVRLWLDDVSALAWMAPTGCTGVQVLAWKQSLNPLDLDHLDEAPCDVLIEAFGCEIAPEFIASCAHIYGAGGKKPTWINLEYLSAEAFSERNHGLPSPVQTGPAAGWIKWFFYPGFTAQTGGLLREPDLAQRQAAFDRKAWLGTQGIEWLGETLLSLFCYEPPALAQLLRELADSGLNGQPVRLLVAAGRAQLAVADALAVINRENKNEKGLWPFVNGHGQLSISYLSLLTQTDFDHLLWACDVNFVRGEDSVARAIWAGKPFVWQIYPQDDGAHHGKLDAFLDLLEAPASLQAFHRAWNSGVLAGAAATWPEHDLAVGLAANLAGWGETALMARTRLLAQSDLTSNLLEFVGKNR